MRESESRFSRLTRSPVLSAALLLFAAAGTGAAALWFASVELHGVLFPSYFTHPLILILNVLPAVLLALLFLAVTGRAWSAYLLTAVTVLGFAIADFYKLSFRDDPLMVSDLLCLREAGNMTERYRLFLTRGIAGAVAGAVFCLVFLALFARTKYKRWPRLALLAVFLAFLAPMRDLYLDEEVYTQRTRNDEHISQWSVTDVYTSKGFWYPFLHSAGEAIAANTPPEGYSAGRAQALLDAYTDADIPEGQKVDILAIQLEAFADFSRIGGLELAEETYAAYHALEQESYTGQLLTNIFAAGTTDTERCFLTGYREFGPLRANADSYVWYLRSQGYATVGSHPSYDWFYNRKNINENLGFEEYLFLENYYASFRDGTTLYDDDFFPELTRLYLERSAASDRPVFTFDVTYQGHGPYDEDIAWHKEQFVRNTQSFTEGQLNILNNYLWCVWNTGNHLASLVETLRQSERPVVLIAYGDHMPWMGAGNSVYTAMGLDLDQSSDAGWRNYYSTRYLIWANDAAKKALGRDFTGEGPEIGPYFLMQEFFSLCGWEGSRFMQVSEAVRGQGVDVMNVPTGRFTEHGNVTDTLSPAADAAYRDYLDAQFLSRTRFTYQSVR